MKRSTDNKIEEERMFMLNATQRLFLRHNTRVFLYRMRRRILCDFLGWHNGKGAVPQYDEYDVFFVNLASYCSRCGRRVIMDSQGNWFAVERSRP